MEIFQQWMTVETVCHQLLKQRASNQRMEAQAAQPPAVHSSQLSDCSKNCARNQGMGAQMAKLRENLWINKGTQYYRMDLVPPHYYLTLFSSCMR